MAKVMDLINSFDQNTKEYDAFLLDLLSTSSDIPFNNEEINTIQNIVITTINTRINQVSTRHRGLEILLKVLPQCSKDVIAKYAILWISKASQTLESVQSDTRELSMACRVIGCLIVRCKEIHELQKQISTQNVKQLVGQIMNIKTDRRCGATFHLVAILLHYYPEPCERLQAQIMKMILSLVDSTQRNLIHAGASCFALLTRATERSFKPPPTKSTYTGWIYSQALICNSLHAIMDDLFTRLIELENVDIWDKLVLPAISEDNVIEYYYGLRQRFANLCVYLSTMLRGHGEKNSTSPGIILQVLCRGLAITPSNLGTEDSFRKQILHFILPKLHVSLFAVLDAFIEGFRQELVPFALTILQLIQQTLKWSETALENSGTLSGSKSFESVRTSAYKSLSTWLVYLGTLSGIEMVANEYLPHLLKDVTPEKDRVLLTVQKTQNLSKRALKKLRDSQYENSTVLGNSTEANSGKSYLSAKLSLEALSCLENMFFSASCWLNQSFYKRVQNIIVPLLYDFYLGTSGKHFYEENPHCRLQLLKTLKALQINPHPATPPPTQYCIEIFSMALSDVDANIIQEAKLTLAELEKVTHPGAPTLRFPVSANNDSQEVIEIEKQADTEADELAEEICTDRRKTIWDRIRSDLSNKVSNKTDERKSDNYSINGDGPTPSKQQKIYLENSEKQMDISGNGSFISERENSKKNSFELTVKETNVPTVLTIETTEKSYESIRETNKLTTVQPNDSDTAVAYKPQDSNANISDRDVVNIDDENQRRIADDTDDFLCLTVDKIQTKSSSQSFIPLSDISPQKKCVEKSETKEIEVTERKDTVEINEKNIDDDAMLDLFCDEPKDID